MLTYELVIGGTSGYSIPDGTQLTSGNLQITVVNPTPLWYCRPSGGVNHYNSIELNDMYGYENYIDVERTSDGVVFDSIKVTASFYSDSGNRTLEFALMDR